jgi:hypothetical protein
MAKGRCLGRPKKAAKQKEETPTEASISLPGRKIIAPIRSTHPGCLPPQQCFLGCQGCNMLAASLQPRAKPRDQSTQSMETQTEPTLIEGPTRLRDSTSQTDCQKCGLAPPKARQTRQGPEIPVPGPDRPRLIRPGPVVKRYSSEPMTNRQKEAARRLLANPRAEQAYLADIRITTLDDQTTSWKFHTRVPIQECVIYINNGTLTQLRTTGILGQDS